jgi:hypothetical protein
MWSSATDLVATGEDGADDDARERMAKAMVSTACLHSCWSEDEGGWRGRRPRVTTVWSMRCKNQTTPSFRRCAGERGGERYRREVVGSPWFTEFVTEGCRNLRPPTVKFAGLAVIPVGKRRGEVRGEAGNESTGCRCRSGQGEVGEGEETVAMITEKKRPGIDDGSDWWGRLVRLAGGLHPSVGKLETGVTVSV